MRIRGRVCFSLVWLLSAVAVHAQVSSAFTYQGRLDENGSPANGSFDFAFDLMNTFVGGVQLATVDVNNVTVVNGLFTVSINFGDDAFPGASRWIRIRVRQAGGGAYTTLSPRHPITSVPYATGLRLPLAQSVSLGETAFSITNNSRVIEGVLSAPYAGTGAPGFSPSVLGTTTTGNGVVGLSSAGSGYGVAGVVSGGNSQAVRGIQVGSSGYAGFFAISNADNPTTAIQVQTNGTGRAATFSTTNSSNSSQAVYASTSGDNANAIEGVASGAFSNGVRGQGLSSGVRGDCSTSNGAGVRGVNNNATGTGVRGDSSGAGGAGVAGYGTGTGVYGQCTAGGEAVFGSNGGSNSNGYAGYFNGRVSVVGTLSKGGGSFQIDHPLDPRNKYLYHSFVESPDMKNIYDGVVVLGADGDAEVVLPDWFGALNRDFRYQLTCIGGYAPVYVSEEITDNRFRIAGGKPGMKVSWMVTGIRQDAYANAYRVPVEEDKDAAERGHLLYPEAFGAAGEMNAVEARRATRALEAEREQTGVPSNILPVIPLEPDAVQEPQTPAE